MSKKLMWLGGIAGAILSIIALGAAVGFEKPWPDRSAIETQMLELAGGLTATIQGQKAMNQKIDRNERRYWVDIEDKALADLELDPNNRSAKRELKRAQDNIRRIDSQ